MDDLVRYTMNTLNDTCLDVDYNSLNGGILSIWLGYTVLLNVTPEKVVGFSTWTKRNGIFSFRSAASIKRTIRRLAKEYAVQ